MWTIHLPVSLLMIVKTLVGVALSLWSASEPSSWRCLGVVTIHQASGILIPIMVNRISWASSVEVFILPLVILGFVRRISVPSEIFSVVVIGHVVCPFFAIFISPVVASCLPPVIDFLKWGSFISSKFYPWFKPSPSFIHFSPKSYCSWSSIGLGLY